MTVWFKRGVWSVMMRGVRSVIRGIGWMRVERRGELSVSSVQTLLTIVHNVLISLLVPIVLMISSSFTETASVGVRAAKGH